MSVWRGAVGVPSTLRVSEAPEEVKPQPVATDGPIEQLLSEATVSSVPELEPRLGDVGVRLKVKNRPLIFCATVLGFMRKLLRVTVMELRLVTKVADALTALPLDDVPMPL